MYALLSLDFNLSYFFILLISQCSHIFLLFLFILYFTGDDREPTDYESTNQAAMTHIMHYPMDARERGETVEVEKDKAFLSMILVSEREREGQKDRVSDGNVERE